MKDSHRILFEPGRIGKLELKNRFYMAPMGPSGMTDADGAFMETAVDYYSRRARGGVGLIITGDCIVLAIGYRSENSLYQELKDLDRPLYLLGDAGRVAKIHYAIWNAYEVARGI